MIRKLAGRFFRFPAFPGYMDDLLELGAEVFALDEIAKILAILALILGVAVIIGGYFLNFSVLDEIGIVGGVIS